MIDIIFSACGVCYSIDWQKKVNDKPVITSHCISELIPYRKIVIQLKRRHSVEVILTLRIQSNTTAVLVGWFWSFTLGIWTFLLPSETAYLVNESKVTFVFSRCLTSYLLSFKYNSCKCFLRLKPSIASQRSSSNSKSQNNPWGHCLLH